MKVVLFCGGLGTRSREYSETIPKPMVDIGGCPIVWHLMRYYAHFGHTEFITCLGYRGDVIKQYFMNHDLRQPRDSSSTRDGDTVRICDQDTLDWTVCLVDTGADSNIGQRLVAVKDYLGDDPVFMANYADGLTDLDLHQYLEYFYERNKVAGFLCVKPSQSFHVVDLDQDGRVRRLRPVNKSDVWINDGFFVFRREIFEYIRYGQELVAEPFDRLIAENQLVAYRNPGFWVCMATFKEKKMLDDIYARGDTPWAVWERSSSSDVHQVALPQKAHVKASRPLLDRSFLA